jgi:Ion channel
MMSCIWVALNLYNGGIIEAKLLAGDYVKGPNVTSPLALAELPTVYIDSLYFVTTSMTTVGYGDIVASSNIPETNALLMMFTMIMQFSGILLFSLTSLRVRSLKSNLDVKGLLNKNLEAMTWYMLEIDNVLEGDIPSKMYDCAIEAMRDSILDSTVNVFKTYPFY